MKKTFSYKLNGPKNSFIEFILVYLFPTPFLLLLKDSRRKIMCFRNIIMVLSKFQNDVVSVSIHSFEIKKLSVTFL